MKPSEVLRGYKREAASRYAFHPSREIILKAFDHAIALAEQEESDVSNNP